MIIWAFFWLEKISGFVSKKDHLLAYGKEGPPSRVYRRLQGCHLSLGLKPKRQEDGVGLLWRHYMGSGPVKMNQIHKCFNYL